MEREDGGDKGKIWIVKKKKERGRGRRGREWYKKEGNIE